MKVFILYLLVACSGSQRQSTIAHTMQALDTAETAFLTFDGKHELDIVSSAASHDDGAKKLADYRLERVKVNTFIIAAYKAVAAAATLNDDPSVAGMVQAAAVVAQELATLGIK